MGEVKKLVCNIDSDLLSMVDDYAASLHVNRTAAVSVLLTTALKQDRLMADLSRMMDLVNSDKSGMKP